jgi:hypothetical protein
VAAPLEVVLRESRSVRSLRYASGAVVAAVVLTAALAGGLEVDAEAFTGSGVAAGRVWRPGVFPFPS